MSYLSARRYDCRLEVICLGITVLYLENDLLQTDLLVGTRHANGAEGAGGLPYS